MQASTDRTGRANEDRQREGWIGAAPALPPVAKTAGLVEFAFLPRRILEKPVIFQLEHGVFFVDCKELPETFVGTTSGLGYRRTMSLTDKAGRDAQWGSTVVANIMNDDCVLVDILASDPPAATKYS